MALVSTFTERPSALKALAQLPVRLSLGASMLYHGVSKLRPAGAAQTAPFFEQLGFRPGKPWTLATGAAELFAGLSAVLGLGTRLGALGVLATQAVAITRVHKDKGFDNTKGGYEFNLALCAMALGLLLRGPGRPSVHSALETRAKRRELRRLKLLPAQRRTSRLLDLVA